MSDTNDPTPPTFRRKISAFASAFESAEINACITYRDVQRIKPGLPREKAEAILHALADPIGEEMLNAGLMVLIAHLEGGPDEH